MAGTRDRSPLPCSQNCHSAPMASACRCTARDQSWMLEPRNAWLEPGVSAHPAWLKPALTAAQPGPGVSTWGQLLPCVMWPEPWNRALGQRLLLCSWGRGSVPGAKATWLEPRASTCHRTAGNRGQRATEAPWPELGVSTCCPAARTRGWHPKPHGWNPLLCSWGWGSVPVASACHGTAGARDWSWGPAPAASSGLTRSNCH